jgi:hypothetical protein
MQSSVNRVHPALARSGLSMKGLLIGNIGSHDDISSGSGRHQRKQANGVDSKRITDGMPALRRYRWPGRNFIHPDLSAKVPTSLPLRADGP